MNEDFKLLVGLDIESKQAENKVKEFTKKREIVTEIKINGTKAFNHLKTYINEMGEAMQTLSFSDKNGNKTNEEILKVSDSFKVLNTEVTKWTDKQGAIHKVTTEIDNFGNTTQTRVTEINNGLNGITTSTENWIKNTNGAFEKVGDTVTNTITDIDKYKKAQQELIQADRERMAEVTKTTTNTKEMVNGHRALVTTIEEENSVLGKVTTRVSQYKDELGRTITVTDKMDASGKKMQGTMTEISDKAHKMSQSFSDILTKVAKFYLASLPIRAMQTAVTETIQTVKEFDDALTDFKKVSDLSGESLDNYTKKLGELGQITARTRKEMVEASTEFVKSGYSEEQSVQLSKIATLFQNIADEEVSTADSASLIISQMKAYGNETEAFANHVVDAINNVSNNMSVSSSDIATGLTKTASAMGALGNDYDHTIALITAGSEIMVHQSSKVAKGLRSIGNNIADLAQKEDTLSFTVKGATKEIQLMDSATGDLKSTYQVLEDIYTSGWEQMTNAEQQSLAITLAKKTQFEVFTSILNNFSGAQKAVGLALNSSGSAMKENEAYMQSLSAKLNLLKAQFSEFVLGNGGLEKFGKAILDIGIKVLKFANTDLGKMSISLSSIYLILTSILKTAKAQVIISTIFKLISGETALSQVTSVLTTKFVENATAWAITPMGMATIAIGGMFALYKAIEYVSMSVERMNEKLEESKSAYESAKSEAENLRNELEEVKRKIDEINSSEKLSITDKKQLQTLKEEEKSLEHQLLLAQELALEKKKQYTKDAEKVLKQTVEDPIAFGREIVDGQVYIGSGTQKEALEKYTEKISESQEKINQYISTLEDLEKAGQKNTIVYTQTLEKLNQEKEARDRLRVGASEYASNIKNAIEYADESNSLVKIALKTLNNYYEVLEDVNEETSNSSETIEDLQEKLEEYDEKVQELAQSLGLTATQLENFTDIVGYDNLEELLQIMYNVKVEMDSASTSIDGFQNALSIAQASMDEYNEKGYLTLDTFQQLMGVSVEYLGALQNENGQLEINQTTLTNLVNAMKQAKLEELANAEATDILAYTQEKTEKMSTLAKTAIGQLGSTIEEASKKAENGKFDMEDFANSVNSIVVSLGGAEVDWNDENIKKIHESYSGLAKEISNTTVATDRLRNKTEQASSRNTKSTDKTREAEQKLKDEVQKVTDAYNKRISAVKKARDEAVKSVEAQIKALKKERDEVVKGLEAQIKSLKNQKEAREKYWEEQIGKLERENKEREKNIELQEKQEALAKAQQQRLMIFKDGQFQYGQDEEAVSDAQQNLIETEDKLTYEEQKQLMEDLKDAELEWYEQRIEALEDYKDRVKENYDEQIEQLEEYKDLLKEQYDAEIEQLEELRDNEKEALEQKLENEKNHYNESISAIQKYNADLSAEVERLKAIIKSLAEISMPSFVVGGGLGAFSGLSVLKAKSTGDNYVNAYANGRASIGDNEMALVGDNPKYREIVIGSKLNNDVGTMLSLKRGSGVVNANATNTLASLFNGLKGSNIKGIERSVTNNNGNSISIGSITLPQVSNGEEFVNYLQNFAMDMTQASYS